MDKLSDKNIYTDISFVKSWLINKGRMNDDATTLDLHNIIELFIYSYLNTDIDLLKETDVIFLNILKKYDNIQNLLNIDFSEIDFSNKYITDREDLNKIKSIIIARKIGNTGNTGNLPSYEELIMMIDQQELFPLDYLEILYKRYSDIIVTDLYKKYLLVELIEKYTRISLLQSSPRALENAVMKAPSSRALENAVMKAPSSRALQGADDIDIRMPFPYRSLHEPYETAMKGSPRREVDNDIDIRMPFPYRSLHEPSETAMKGSIVDLIKAEQAKDITNLKKVHINSSEKYIVEIMSEIHKIIDRDSTQDIQYIFKKVDYTVLASNLITRNIDILLHYITKEEEEFGTHETNIIRILERLPVELIIGIFNDPTVIYPYGRSYLNKKKTATMSSILVSQFIYIYHYVLTNHPTIEVDPITDLLLILNQLFALGLSENRYIHIYREIIINLKQRLIDRYLFSNEWFQTLLNTLKIALMYSKDVAKTRRTLLTFDSFFHSIRFTDSWKRSIFNYDRKTETYSKSDFDLQLVFKKYNSWETAMIVDTDSINFLDEAENINEPLIEYVRGIFNDEDEYRNKYLKYKNKYLNMQSMKK